MALHWLWKDKCGEATFRFWDGEERTVSLYEGNAFLIFINEYKENGKDMYNLFTFFADEAHAKNMLGLGKGENAHNTFNTEREKLIKVRLNKKKCKAGKIISLLVRAFDDLTIELYKE